MNDQVSFGEWLEDQLKDRRWSQAGFAEMLEVARSTVSSWVNGYQPPRRRMCRRIAEALGVDENEVLVRAGHAPKDPNFRLGQEAHIKEGGKPYDLARRSGSEADRDEAWDQIDRKLAELEDEIRELRRQLKGE